MKERPILFQGDMVRAILSGSKTQTRRICKHLLWTGEKEDAPAHIEYWYGGIGAVKPCPYGQPGDQLWVRETWGSESFVNDGDRTVYRADKQCRWADGETAYLPTDYKLSSEASGDNKWRPSIHMPRWASRITLEIANVRVERVRDISGKDILKEGVRHPIYHPGSIGSEMGLRQCVFPELWDSINGKREGCSWKDNPWVWVVEFSRLEAQP